MSDDELEQAIEDLCSNQDWVGVFNGELNLDGTFTYQEIVAIAELLKKEGRA